MIEDRLLRRLKQRAAQDGRTLQGLVNDLLRQALAPAAGGTDYLLRLEGWDARERPGVNVLDRDALFDLMDGR